MDEGLRILLKVARLYYTENFTQQEIANNLGLSRVKVHRILLKAREEGIVEINIHDPSENNSEMESLFEKMFKLKECDYLLDLGFVGDVNANFFTADAILNICPSSGSESVT